MDALGDDPYVHCARCGHRVQLRHTTACEACAAYTCGMCWGRPCVRSEAVVGSMPSGAEVRR